METRPLCYGMVDGRISMKTLVPTIGPTDRERAALISCCEAGLSGQSQHIGSMEEQMQTAAYLSHSSMRIARFGIIKRPLSYYKDGVKFTRFRT